MSLHFLLTILPECKSSSPSMKTAVKSTLLGYGASQGSHANTCQPQSSAGYNNTVVDDSTSGVSSYDSGYRSLVTQNYHVTYQRDFNLDRDYVQI